MPSDNPGGAAPLSQIHNAGSTNLVYGMDRLLTDDGSAQTWYLGDALGSVRATLDGAGAVQVTVRELVLSAAEGIHGARHSPPLVPRTRGK